MCIRDSYTTLQIILVNDGSTDHSGEICDEYTRKDTRIEVIHQMSSVKSTNISSRKKDSIYDNSDDEMDDEMDDDCLLYTSVLIVTSH